MESLKREVWLAARDGRTDRIVELLWKAGGENVNDVLNNLEVENGQSTTPLIIAARNGHEEVVYVLLIFGVDIAQKGTVLTADNEVYYDVTALWCAAEGRHYNIVKALAQNGASVNCPAKCGSQPLGLACYFNDLEMVQYLVKHGAEVNCANISKTTCLMDASEKGYFDVVQYLLIKGANPMATDCIGQTALHMAAENGHLCVSKVLVESRATMTKDIDGLTPLMLAAMNGNTETVEYLSMLPECRREDYINATELLGASFMFTRKHRKDISKAYYYFQTAMQERFKDSDNIIPKRIVPPLLSVLLDTEECTTLSQLKDIRGNELALAVEAILVGERILGTSDWQLREHMFDALELLVNMNELDKCKNLLLYVLKLQQDSDEEVDVNYFMELMANMFNCGIQIDFLFLLESFQIVELEAARDEYQIKGGETNYQNPAYEADILACMYLIGLLLLTYTSKDDEKQMYLAVNNFVQLNTKLQNGFTPLHICCSSLTNDYRLGFGDAVVFPNARICKTLVTCGANVNAQDIYYNTPLHIIAECKILDDDIHRDIIICLVENGAHIDARNIYDMTVADVACTSMTESLILGHMELSLGCLSARVIMEHGIQYKGIIPVPLYEFVELHGCNR